MPKSSQPSADSQQPPQPPEIERKLRFAPAQAIGVPLIALVPLLALLGLFGESRTATTQQNEQVALQVDAVTRDRYWTPAAMRIDVTNLAAQAPATITVAIDREYLDHFGNVTLTPNAKQITADAYVVELTDIGPGETRRVDVGMKPNDYWLYHGDVTATADAGAAVTIPIRTFIFP